MTDEQHASLLQQLASSHVFETHVLRSTNEPVSWLPLIPVGNAGSQMGLTAGGFWVVGGTEGLVLLRTPHAFVATLPLLEQPRSSVSRQIRAAIKVPELRPRVEQLFPETDVVRMGFDIHSDYWAILALDWFIELDTIKKRHLLDYLATVSRASWASQKVRHKAMCLHAQYQIIASS